MSTKSTAARTKLHMTAGVVATLALILATSTAASADQSAGYHGTFNETDTGAGLGYDIHGSARMTISANGTAVKVNIAGLDPEKAYGSHLHNGTCGTGGGGHYQDAEGGAIVPPNELHIANSGTTLKSNPGGVAHAGGTAPWQARTSSTTQTNALSMVVHEPGGARIVCADLS